MQQPVDEAADGGGDAAVDEAAGRLQWGRCGGRGCGMAAGTLPWTWLQDGEGDDAKDEAAGRQQGRCRGQGRGTVAGTLPWTRPRDGG